MRWEAVRWERAAPASDLADEGADERGVLAQLVVEGEHVERVVQLPRDVGEVVDERHVGEGARRAGKGLHDHLVVVDGVLLVEEGEEPLEGL